MTKLQRVAKPQAKSTSSKGAASPVSKALPKEARALAKAKDAEVLENADGSVTRRRETANASMELTSSKGKLRETTQEFSKSATTEGGTQSRSVFVAKTDMLGRAWIDSSRETVNAKGDTNVVGRTADVFGIEKHTTQKHTSRERGNTLESVSRTTSKDSRGNAAKSSDVTRATARGKQVVTTNEKRVSGEDLTTRSSTTFEDGRFTLADGADWQKNLSVDKSSVKDTEVDAAKVDQVLAKADRWGGIFAKVFKALGLDQEWLKTLPQSLIQQHALLEGDHGSVFTQLGVTGSQRFAINGDGVQAGVDREAKAGIYANAQGEVAARFGAASYDVSALAEASAWVDAQGKLDSTGLDAVVNAKVRVAVEAQVTGSAQSQSVSFLGIDLFLATEGRARVTAEASAEVTGTVKVLRTPPTAIAQGTAGASAVAKAEGDVKLSAGPFSVVGSAYASAGAEARASGVIGYEEGKFKLGGSVGAALGLGVGAGVTVEVDVRQMGEMAKNAADLNGDGKLGLGDASFAVKSSARKVALWFGF